MLMRGTTLALCAAAVATAGCSRHLAVITIDPAERHQVMRGWEVTANMTDDDHPEAVPLYREQMYDRAIAEVGIDRLRLEVRSGAEGTNQAWKKYSSGQISYEAWRPMRYPTVNDNNDPNVIDWAGFDFSELDEKVESVVLPLKSRAEARGERLFINLCYVAFTEQITEGAYHHHNPEEYAEFVLATYLHLKDKYGFVPDSWEVLLEPDNNTREWNASVMANAVVAASRRLKENGFTPAFVAPSTMDMASAVPWIEEIARTPGAMENIVEFSYHRYRNSSSDNARKIAEIAKRFGKPTAMLEWWFGYGNYRILHEDVAIAGNASWQGRVLRGLFDVRYDDPRAPAVEIAGDTRLNQQYFRYVRFGAQRIGASSTDPENTRPTAFVNRDGGTVIVIDTTEPTSLTIRDAPPGQYSITYALESGGSAAAIVVTDENGEIVVDMPGRGVMTISSAEASRMK